MEGSVLSFLKAEWKVSDTGSAHCASSFEVPLLTIQNISIDASYQVPVHFAKRFQRRRFKKIGQSETRILEIKLCWYSVTCLFYTLQVDIHILIFFLANLAKGNMSFCHLNLNRGHSIDDSYQVSVVAMFVNDRDEMSNLNRGHSIDASYTRKPVFTKRKER
jgi:hypothetical protein